ncbi:7884_t:CDS:2, partial [Acaulospora colombiana]
FVEGPLVAAVRQASSETLEAISIILQGSTDSIILAEQAGAAPIKKHPNFRLFACMNPATDVGKKDLPGQLRSYFTEHYVIPPDADRDALLSIISKYIGHVAMADKQAIMDMAEFYTEARKMAERGEIADGSNQRPHYSMRTLARALAFAVDVSNAFVFRRALWEGSLMAFSTVLEPQSAAALQRLAFQHIFNGCKNVKSLLSQMPPCPPGAFIALGPFWLAQGPNQPLPVDHYILTPSVQAKLLDLARVILTRRFPILIEGPTSSGKTSAIEYLARLTGHRFVRINNHEHTDIQEYIGSYVTNPSDGRLVFHEGLLVQALRRGEWIVLDELNLAPSDVLEALNRLLDDNRELLVPETGEVIKPHPNFVLFATQNPSGLYAGRKILSRAFRNRFLEVHFQDVPPHELEQIIEERCQIPKSYAHRIVTVFHELQARRQTDRVFETKHGFATLRDLFRWAGREAGSVQELADNGYMLIAERSRKLEDKLVVKEVIEEVMKVRIEETVLYNIRDPKLPCPAPQDTSVIWTTSMQRLFILLARALQHSEPVLLVGDTGCGKTSVCELYAAARQLELKTVNCHQNMETADLLELTESLPEAKLTEAWAAAQNPEDKAILREIAQLMNRSTPLFEWSDGPLVSSMQSGSLFLLDEISLADDSVLERMNSVLEPSRTLVLAEKGGWNSDNLEITAKDGFRLVATMNPGGDYGKKELSPALRNRFTEIWVPPVDNRDDRLAIVQASWRHRELQPYTEAVIDFAHWIGRKFQDDLTIGLRDLLNEGTHGALLKRNFHGLASLPQAQSWGGNAIVKFKEDARVELTKLVPSDWDPLKDYPISSSADTFGIGPFK